MVETKAKRISKTVDFFSFHDSNPLLNKEKKISLLLLDLIDIVLSPTDTLLSIKYWSELNNVLQTMQELMFKNVNGTYVSQERT